MPLLRGQTIITRRFPHILRNTQSFVATTAGKILRADISLFGRAAKESRRLDIILRNTETFETELGQSKSRVGMILARSFLKPSGGFDMILFHTGAVAEGHSQMPLRRGIPLSGRL